MGGLRKPLICSEIFNLQVLKMGAMKVLEERALGWHFAGGVQTHPRPIKSTLPTACQTL